MNNYLRVHGDVSTKNRQLADHNHQYGPSAQYGKRPHVILPRIRSVSKHARNSEYAKYDEPFDHIRYTEYVLFGRRKTRRAVQLANAFDNVEYGQQTPCPLHRVGIMDEKIAGDRIIAAHRRIFLPIFAFGRVVAVVRQHGHHVHTQKQYEHGAETQSYEIIRPYFFPLQMQEGDAQRMF